MGTNENSAVMVEFSIIGGCFPLSEITNKLQIEPTRAYSKGNSGKFNNIRKETCWCIGTGYEESMDINDQLSKIINKIKDKKEILKGLKNQYNLMFKFFIVINIIDNDKPGIYLDQETIHFASELSASFDIDYYIFSKD